MLRRLLLGQRKREENVEKPATDDKKDENNSQKSDPIDITKSTENNLDDQRKTKELEYESESEGESDSVTDSEYNETSEYSSDASQEDEVDDDGKTEGFKMTDNTALVKDCSQKRNMEDDGTSKGVLLFKKQDEGKQIAKKEYCENTETLVHCDSVCSAKDNNINKNDESDNTTTTTTPNSDLTSPNITPDSPKETITSPDVTKSPAPSPANPQNTTTFIPQQYHPGATSTHGKIPLRKPSVGLQDTTRKTTGGQFTCVQKKMKRNGVHKKLASINEESWKIKPQNSKSMRPLGSQKFHKKLNCDISVEDLERILGVNFDELEEVMRKTKEQRKAVQLQVRGVKLDKGGNGEGKRAANIPKNAVIAGRSGISEDSNGTSEDVKTRICKDLKQRGNTEKAEEATDTRRSPDSESGEKGTKDEISSDSGVSESNGETTCVRSPEVQRYMSRKYLLKHKKCLQKEIVDLEERMAVMEEHKKDVQCVHDLMDLYNDGLKKVERNNVGVPCVLSLKGIIARQIREMDDGEFQKKMESLENLGVPQFTKIHKLVGKLHSNMVMSLEDDRKCRSTGVQNMRFEIGKILGMCQALLDCVYEE